MAVHGGVRFWCLWCSAADVAKFWNVYVVGSELVVP